MQGGFRTMMSAMHFRWRPLQWQLFLAVCCYLGLTVCFLTNHWIFERDSLPGYTLPALTVLYTFGLLGHHPRVRTWAIYTPAVALYGFWAALAQKDRIGSFPGIIHCSAGDSYLDIAGQFLMIFLVTFVATIFLIQPEVRTIFTSETALEDTVEMLTTRRRWYHVPWQNLLAAGGYGAVIYFSIVAALGFPGDYLFRYYLPAVAALIIIGLLLQNNIARYVAMIVPILALAGVIVFFHLAELMNVGSTSYPRPGDTYTYFACEFIPVYIFTLPALVLFRKPRWMAIKRKKDE